MSTSDPFDPLQTTGQFFAVLKSLAKFDELEVNGVIRSLLGTSDREKCFIAACTQSFMLAADAYREILLAVIDEFKIEKVDAKIKGKLKAARMLPFTDSPEQAERILSALTS